MKKTPARRRPACSANLFQQLASIRATCERNHLGPNPSLSPLEPPSSSSSSSGDDDRELFGADDQPNYNYAGPIARERSGHRDSRRGAGIRVDPSAPAGGSFCAGTGAGTGALDEDGRDGDADDDDEDSEDEVSGVLSAPPRRGGFCSEAPSALSSAYSLKHSVAALKEAAACQESCLHALLEKQAHVRALLDKDRRLAASAAQRDADMVTLRLHEEGKARRRPSTAHPLSRVARPAGSVALQAPPHIAGGRSQLEQAVASSRAAAKAEALSEASRPPSSASRTARGEGRPLYRIYGGVAVPLASTAMRQSTRDGSYALRVKGLPATGTPTGQNGQVLPGSRPLYRTVGSISQRAPR